MNNRGCQKTRLEKHMSETNLEYLAKLDHSICNELCALNIEESKCFECNENVPCYDCYVRNLKWLLEEREKPILNDAEKEYLSAVIKPFREKIECIFKAKLPNFDEYYIIVGLKDNDSLRFPCFKANTMYKGMELDKSYTLEELGL